VDVWRYYQPNPKKRNTGDCSVRAIAKALDVDWETAYSMLVVTGFILGDMPSSNSVWGSVLRQHGFYRETISNECPDCYDIGDFADEHPNGTYVVGTGSHVVAVKDGIVFDSWDSTKEIPLYYWSREERN
jgi:hypothetical protein